MTPVRALAIMVGSIAAMHLAAIGCGDDGGTCPDSLAAHSSEWRAPGGARAQCAELAAALNASGRGLADVAGDGGSADCAGIMNQRESGGVCRASISSTCEGVTFDIECTVRRDRTADCDVTIDAAELERSCELRLLLR